MDVNDLAASSPPRYRWLLRIAIAYVLIVVAFSIVTYAWWRRGIRVRDDVYARLRAANAPTSVTEMNARLDLRSSDAAADAGRQIAALMPTSWRQPSSQPVSTAEQARLDAASRWEDAHDARAPATPWDVVPLRASVNADAAALSMLDAVLNGRPIDWGVRYRSPINLTLLPYLNAARNAGKLLAQSATLAHADDDDALAVRRLIEAMTLADATARPPTPLVGVVSGASIVHGLVGPTIESIAATLRVGDATGAARRADVDALIARLLDDGPPHDALLAAFQGESCGRSRRRTRDNDRRACRGGRSRRRGRGSRRPASSRGKS